MSVLPGLILAISLRRATVRFSTPSMTSMTSVAKKMQGDEPDTDKDPNPVLCQPSHIQLPYLE